MFSTKPDVVGGDFTLLKRSDWVRIIDLYTRVNNLLYVIRSDHERKK